MRIAKFSLIFSLMLSAFAYGQTPGAPDVRITTGGGFEAGGAVVTQNGAIGQKMMIRREMGEWWKDSEIAKKLQLTDDQVSRLNQTFYNHRLKLIDYGAEVEKSDLKLQTLLDSDVPNEDQVGTQVDQVLVARGKLEREYTMMNLDLRKVLSLDQWKQLKAIRAENGPGDVFFYRKFGPGARRMQIPDDQMPLPDPMPLPPGPPGGDAF